MITRFIYQKKELCFITQIVPIDIGDIVEYDSFERDVGPSKKHIYPKYKVIGKSFRITHVFDGELLIYLRKTF